MFKIFDAQQTWMSLHTSVDVLDVRSEPVPICVGYTTDGTVKFCWAYFIMYAPYVLS
jgi:hypothetical protein